MTDLDVYRWLGQVAATSSDISIVRADRFGLTMVWFVATARGEAALTRSSIEQAAERMSVRNAGSWLRLCAAQRSAFGRLAERLAAAHSSSVPSEP